MIDIFNRSDRFKFELSPFFVALVAFCFSMTIGVLWEFFEFFMDVFAKTDMQKDTILQTISSVSLNPSNENTPILIQGIEKMTVSGSNMTVNGTKTLSSALDLGGYLDIGIVDTISDLLVNFIGAVLFSIIGFFYCKSQGNGPFAQRFIPQLNQNNDTEKADNEK